MLLNKFYLQDEADDGNDLGGGGDPAPAAISNEQFQMLGQTVQILAANLQEMQNNQNAITETLAKIAEARGADSKDARDDAHDLLETVDLDTMSRKDLYNLIMSQVEKGVQGSIKGGISGLEERLNNLTAHIESRNADVAVTAAAEKHADFMEWTDEMRVLLKENPNISIERAYTLARAENPNKVEKLRAKYEEKPAPKARFTLLPSSGSGADGTKKMNAQDAALAAFDKVMSQFDLNGTDGLKIN